MKKILFKAHNIRGEYRDCEVCAGKFWAYRYRIEKGGARFCSRKCSSVAMKGKRVSPDTEFKKGHGGIPREYKKGKDAPTWKENPTYNHIHDWVRKEKGSAKECEWCDDPKGRFEWANISGEYKRDLSDFVSLCSSCHNKYDKRR